MVNMKSWVISVEIFRVLALKSWLEASGIYSPGTDLVDWAPVHDFKIILCFWVSSSASSQLLYGNRKSTCSIAACKKLGVNVCRYAYSRLLGPFYGAIAFSSVTRCCCCCGHRCARGTRQWRHATVATPGEWQCKTGGVRRLAVANGPNIFQMLLVLDYYYY